MAIPEYRTLKIASASVSSFGATTKATVTITDSVHLVKVYRVKVKRTGGSGTTFQPRIYSASAGTAGAITQEFAASSTAIADLCDVATDGVLCNTDATGALYLEPGPNSGSDNAFDYVIVYEVLA